MRVAVNTGQQLSAYDQEIPHPLTAGQPAAARGWATDYQHLQDIWKAIKVKQAALASSSIQY